MMRRISWLAPLACLAPLALAACGYTDGGSGTNNLLVRATAVYEGGNSLLRADVSLEGTPVDTAVVTMVDDKTGDELPLALTATAGRYEATVPGYHRRLELDIRPNDGHANPFFGLLAKLEGPGPHVVQSPNAGATKTGGGALEVTWSTRDGISADDVVLSVYTNTATPELVLERTVTVDTGASHAISLTELPVGAYLLHVTRQNAVDLKGGVPGSRFENAYDVVTNFLRN